MKSLSFPTLLAAVLASSVLAAPAPETAEPTFCLTPWGVIDPAGGRVCVTGASGNVEALDLATGKLRWSAGPGRPVAVLDGWVVVRVIEGSRTARMVLLDGEGKERLRSEPIRFERVVLRANVQGEWSSLPHGEVWFERDLCHLRWRGRLILQLAGMAPGDPRGTDGVIVFDCKRGKVENRMGAEAPAGPGPRVPLDVARAAERAVKTAEGSENRVRRSGNLAFALDREGGDGRQRAVLKRWNLKTGRVLEPIELASGRELEVASGTDERTVFVRQGRSWRIFQVATGRLMGQVPAGPRELYQTTWADRVYIVSYWDSRPRHPRERPRLLLTLQAFSLKTGEELWDHSLESLSRLGLGDLP